MSAEPLIDIPVGYELPPIAEDYLFLEEHFSPRTSEGVYLADSPFLFDRMSDDEQAPLERQSLRELMNPDWTTLQPAIVQPAGGQATEFYPKAGHLNLLPIF